MSPGRLRRARAGDQSGEDGKTARHGSARLETAAPIHLRLLRVTGGGHGTGARGTPSSTGLPQHPRSSSEINAESQEKSPPVPILLLWAQHPAKLGHPKFQGVGEMGQLRGWGTCACPTHTLRFGGLKTNMRTFLAPSPFSVSLHDCQTGVNGAFSRKPTPLEGPQRPASPPRAETGFVSQPPPTPDPISPRSPKSSLAFATGGEELVRTDHGANVPPATSRTVPSGCGHSPYFYFYFVSRAILQPKHYKNLQEAAGGKGATSASR